MVPRLDSPHRQRAREIARADAQLAGRYWLTAKAARALGHRVPADMPDDHTVTFTTAGSAP